MKPPLIAIIGPTAVGKTATSLQLSEEFNHKGLYGGEIVSADSRQIYRGMDIGTDKASPEAQARVPHHLLDVVDPDETLTLAQYQALAYAAIDDIHTRRRMPFLVGGTGLYVRAVLEGLVIPAVPPDHYLRAELEQEAEARGDETLLARLQVLDPVAAQRIDPRNRRRVIRALEVCIRSGRPFSEQQRAEPPPYRMLKIGLIRPRPVLYERIDRRVDAMLRSGFVEEVRGLLEQGYGPELPAMSGLGYRQVCRYLAGEWTLEEAAADLKRATRRLVRRQANWFRLDDPTIHWFDLAEGITSGTEAAPYDQIAALVREFLDNV